jgi:hypothetical protein
VIFWEKCKSQAREFVLQGFVSVVDGWLRQKRSLVGASEVRLKVFALCGFAKVKIANNEGQLETKGGLRE